MLTNETWSPMLCGRVDTPPEGEGWFMEPKLDGWRAIAVRDSDGASIRSRSGARIDAVPYLNDAIADAFPEGTVLDGEIVSTIRDLADGETSWNQVQTVCSRSEQHRPTPASPALVYVAYDLLAIGGHDARGLAFSDRRDLLESLFEGRDPSLVQLNPCVPSSRAALEVILDAGLEGAVVKRGSGRYLGGRRDQQFKIKPQDTEDVLCIGFYDPTPGSKYDGRAVGGIRFRRANGYEGKAAGMNDRDRALMLTSPDLWVGRVVEIRHHGETVGGAVRHPQYVRVRDPKDKPAEEVAPQREGPPQREVPAAPAAHGRMRNYKAMKDEKLLRSIRELREQSGEAWEKCTNGGSGEPERDLEVATGIAADRGL